MFKLIGFFFKAVVVIAAVLAAGHLIEWDGRTLSDRVGAGVASVEKTDTARKVRGWAEGVIENAREGVDRKVSDSISTLKSSVDKEEERILKSERAKLRELIKELNN